MTVSRILRYQLMLSTMLQHVEAPSGPVIDVEILAQPGPLQAVRIDLWIDAAGPPTRRTFQVLGTGATVPDGAWHVGSCARHAGFKWHVYEHALPPEQEEAR